MGDALTTSGERWPVPTTHPLPADGGTAVTAASTSSSPDHYYTGGLVHNCSQLAPSFSGHLAADENSGAAFYNVSTFYDLLLNHGDIKMRDDLLRYMTPVVIIVGNLSNLIALFVLRRKKLRRNSVCFYMCAYAVANLLTLNLMLGIGWVCFAFNKIYVSNLTDWSCRLWSFLTNVITYCGIWFVVAMNIDRLLHTLSRSGAQSHCSVFSAKAAVTAIVIGLIVVSIHAMWTYELQPHGCYVPFQQGDMHILIWPWWSATVYTYLPLFLIISLNLVHIIILLLRYFQELHGSPQADASKDSFVVPVIVVSMSFFLLAVPATVTNILDIHMPPSWLSVDLVARMELTKKITEILSSLNQVVFGAQLLVSSGEFRRECAALLRAVFCCVGPKRNIKMFELRPPSNSEDSSPDRQVDYELCNNNDEIITSV